MRLDRRGLCCDGMVGKVNTDGDYQIMSERNDVFRAVAVFRAVGGKLVNCVLFVQYCLKEMMYFVQFKCFVRLERD